MGMGWPNDYELQESLRAHLHELRNGARLMVRGSFSLRSSAIILLRAATRFLDGAIALLEADRLEKQSSGLTS